MRALTDLVKSLQDAGLPISHASGPVSEDARRGGQYSSSLGVTCIAQDLANQQAIDDHIAAFDWSDAAAAAALNARERAENVVSLTTRDLSTKKLVSALALLVQELNAHAEKVNALLTAIDGAATFAGLKTAIAALPDLRTVTKPQFLTALQNAINAGEGES